MFLPKELESLLKAPNNVSTSQITIPEAISSLYQGIDVHRLEVELHMLPGLVKV